MFRKQERTLQECAINLSRGSLPRPVSKLSRPYFLPYSFYGIQHKVGVKGEVGRVGVIKVYGEFDF
jgi:hypothetical protein